MDHEKLRFDFNGDAMTADQILQVEKIVNKNIDDSLPVETKVVPFVKATQIQGLRKCAEDYPEKVRVVSVGTNADSILKDPSNSKWSDYSVELCGGTWCSSAYHFNFHVSISSSNHKVSLVSSLMPQENH